MSSRTKRECRIFVRLYFRERARERERKRERKRRIEKKNRKKRYSSVSRLRANRIDSTLHHRPGIHREPRKLLKRMINKTRTNYLPRQREWHERLFVQIHRLLM
ncbi:hypothetical protein PUN28_011068 [Cardiocondyla obscurior]|uniref:Uncharacterized protein n=1 Tax=Cardiocondyla obscurior TaxID=286306 RepID=A0AAW2FPZ4_9HYME